MHSHGKYSVDCVPVALFTDDDMGRAGITPHA